METFAPNAYLVGGPVPVGSGAKDPRAVRAAADAAELRMPAADGSGIHIWHRTGRFRAMPGPPLREFTYAGPAA